MATTSTIRVRVIDVDNVRGRAVFRMLDGERAGGLLTTRWDPAVTKVTHIKPGDEDELTVGPWALAEPN